MKRIIIFWIGLVIFSLSACEKGEMGPQGEKGERGEQGIAGEDGTKVFSGTAVPAANLGDIGDFYLRTSNSVLYGPKANDGWGSGVSLKGATGAPGAKGADGAKILSGTTAPTAAQGTNGDFYFRTSTGVLYGPKTSSGWGSGTSLKGPKGDKGDKGDTGNANVLMFDVSIKWSSNGRIRFDVPVSREIRERSMAMVYLSEGDPSVWIPAHGYLDPSHNFVVQISVGAGVGAQASTHARITAELRKPNGTGYYTSLVKGFSFRVFFVEASQYTKMNAEGVDLNDYNQVKAALKF